MGENRSLARKALNFFLGVDYQKYVRWNGKAQIDMLITEASYHLSDRIEEYLQALEDIEKDVSKKRFFDKAIPSLFYMAAAARAYFVHDSNIKKIYFVAPLLIIGFLLEAVLHKPYKEMPKIPDNAKTKREKLSDMLDEEQEFWER